MNFRVKCALQWLFSFFPKGEKLNYLFQKYYSSALFEEKWFVAKKQLANLHLNNFFEYQSLDKNTFKYYEFGAGWDLIIPIFMGINGFKVTTIDIRRLVFSELILNSLNHFSKDHNITSVKNIDQDQLLDYLKRKLNLTYIAPLDARNTAFDQNSIDFISSTATFEHIPEHNLWDILKECNRILKPGGILSTQIDYRDHWAYFDSNLSIYNYLKYSDQEWKKYNPPLHYQNRLRHNDYKRIVEAANFEIIKEDTMQASENELMSLKTIDLAKKYKDYHIQNLSIKQATFVLKKMPK